MNQMEQGDVDFCSSGRKYDTKQFPKLNPITPQPNQ